MARSSATTVDQYLAELPAERREVIASIRNLILENLPPGYEEVMNWGSITYQVPLSRYPKTYNRQPLMYVGLAAQKNYYTLYLLSVYGEGEARLRQAFEKAGRKLDMGKSCVHFRSVDDLPLDVIAKVVGETSVDDHIAQYERARAGAR
jgi:hypothetical protein